jgi:hypothetical protein
MDEKQAQQEQAKARKLRTGWILASIAIAFFVGMILRHWVK